MTSKESELLKLLQKKLTDADKKNSVKRKYSVALRTSDPNDNCTLITASDNSSGNIEYTICYNTTSDEIKYVTTIDPSKTYYCSTWTELQELCSYLVVHPELFNPQEDSSDLLDHPELCFTVGDLDEYIEEHTDYDVSSLYDDYDDYLFDK